MPIKGPRADKGQPCKKVLLRMAVPNLLGQVFSAPQDTNDSGKSADRVVPRTTGTNQECHRQMQTLDGKAHSDTLPCLTQVSDLA